MKISALALDQINGSVPQMSHLPRIDHIIIGATNLKSAADHLYETFGLRSYTGGRHQGWGTENIIVPLGEGYLEIAAVFDKELAKTIDWGRYESAPQCTAREVAARLPQETARPGHALRPN